MRTYLTKCSRMFECGAVQKCVHHVDIVKSFQSIQTSIQCLLAKFGFDTTESEPLESGNLEFGWNLGIWKGANTYSNSQKKQFEQRAPCDTLLVFSIGWVDAAETEH